MEKFVHFLDMSDIRIIVKEINIFQEDSRLQSFGQIFPMKEDSTLNQIMDYCILRIVFDDFKNQREIIFRNTLIIINYINYKEYSVSSTRIT